MKPIEYPINPIRFHPKPVGSRSELKPKVVSPPSAKESRRRVAQTEIVEAILCVRVRVRVDTMHEYSMIACTFEGSLQTLLLKGI